MRAVARSAWVAAAALAIAAGLSVLVLRDQTGVAGWNAAFTALTDTKFTNTLGLLWWGVLLIPLVGELARTEMQIRYGSPAHAAQRVLGHALLIFTIGAAMTVAVAAVAASGGPESPWVSDAVAPAFSSAALANSFASPWVAAIAVLGFTAITYMVVALVTLTLALLISARVALGVLVVIYLWAALSSFGTFDTLPALDLSRLISLAWALHTDSLIPAIGILTTTAAACVLSLRVASFPTRSTFRQIASSRVSAVVIPVVAGVFAYLAPTSTSPTFAEFLATFFAGVNGDIIQYAGVMALILGYSTAATFRLFERASEQFGYEAIRFGTPTRWTLRASSTEIAIGSAVGIGIAAATAAAYLLRTGQLLSTADLAAAAACGLALAVQIAMYIALGVALLWLSTTTTTWLALVGVALVLGYPLIVNLGPANIFASFSTPLVPSAIAASAGILIAALLASVVAGRVLRTPAIAT